MPACNTAVLGNDTFVAATEDVHDAVFVMVGGVSAELALQKRCRFSFSGEGTCGHCLVGSPDSKYVLVVSTAKASTRNYIIHLQTGEVSIFETSHAATVAVWHPEKEGVFFLLLANQMLDVLSVDHIEFGCSLKPTLQVPILSFISGYFSRNSTSEKLDAKTSSYSQRCVINDAAKMVDRVVDMCFIPRTVGLPLMMSLVTSGGDIFAVILRGGFEPQPHAPVVDAHASLQQLQSWYRNEDGHNAPFLKLIATIRSHEPSDAPLQHMWHLDDHRGGRYTVAVLRTDSSVGLLRVTEDGLLSTNPNPHRVPVHEGSPAVTIRFATSIPAGITPTMRCYDNVILVSVGDLFAGAVVLPIWMAGAEGCWVLRAPSCHWIGSTCPALSYDPSRHPSPLSFCLPLRLEDHVATVSCNDILVCPTHSAGEPIVLKLSSLIGTALRGTRDGPVSFLHDEHVLEEEDVGMLANLQEFLGSASASFYATDRTASSVANDVPYSTCRSQIDLSANLLMRVHELLGPIKMKAENMLAELSKDATLASQRMRSLSDEADFMATRLQNCNMHRHGTDSLFEVNRQLGEIHVAIKRMERGVGSQNKERLNELFHEHHLK